MHTDNAGDGNWLDLGGRVAVVTGAGSGIGAEIARQLAAQGMRVALLDRHGDAARAVADEIAQAGGQALAVVADVARVDSVAAAAAEVQQAFGPCQVLVNNAAIQPQPAALMTLDLAQWNQLLSVNLTGALICAQVFGAQMSAAGRGGCMVHIASIGGEHALPKSGAYCVGKSGLMMLSRMLSLELSEQRIRSNVVMPGLVHTPATDFLYSDPDVVARRNRLSPVGRISRPMDLANAVAFLASDRADYINGQEIVVDGGLSRTLMTQVPRPASSTGS